MRTTHRILKVARTIADFEDSKQVEMEHIKESISYRVVG